jgi:hypothetical protein
VQLHRQCLYALDFPQLRSRADEVKAAHKKTFSWILDKDSEVDESAQRSKFKQWLRSDDPRNNVLWILGQPGAGKSTLMKFIAHQPALRTHSQAWAGSQSVVIAGYYFWRYGSTIQRSLRGPLQSLLYQTLRQRPQLMSDVFPEHQWIYGGTEFQFPFESLQDALGRLVAAAPKHGLRLVFLVDGLDEFHDRPGTDYAGSPDVRSLLGLLRIVYSSNSAKMCVSSRPLNEFATEFRQDADQSLRVHDPTRPDIEVFVDGTLRRNPKFLPLAEKDPTYASLMAEIIRAAEGVFQWVSLTCNSLLDGLTNADRISDLRRRLELLPHELDEMYEHILSNIGPGYRRNAARSLLSICNHASSGTFLWHMYLDDDERASIPESLDPSTEDGAQELVDYTTSMLKIFNARSKCLLESGCSGVPEKNDVFSNNWRIHLLCKTIPRPTHRTVVEFICKSEVRERLQADAGQLDVELDTSVLLSELTIAATISLFKGTACDSDTVSISEAVE